ncbi:MAG: DUF429 domain-containing protein [Candidatus Pacearchaeota archaeon]|nr:DUF429 domain-containing protein [Candidatus Pacearchaeota archaeon]
MKYCGIDLAVAGKTGICILDKKAKLISRKLSIEEIAKIICGSGAKVVAIDAPLSLPHKNYYRECDRKVRKAGILIFSFHLPSLVELAKAGMKLAAILRKNKIKVIETYPHAVLKLNKDIAKKVTKTKFRNKDERDAYVCALVAKNFFLGKARCFSGGGKIWY